MLLEPQSRITGIGRFILLYLWNNKIYTAIVVFSVVALMLWAWSAVDIFIPCLWESMFSFKCPGCGLTRSFIQILSFDFTGAFHTNPLIFVIIPSVIYYIYSDFRRFRRESD